MRSIDLFIFSFNYSKIPASSDLRVISQKIIIEGPQSQQVCLGCQVSLDCLLSESSSEYTKVSWKKDNNDVATNERITIDPKTFQLQIQDAKIKDSGNYDF